MKKLKKILTPILSIIFVLTVLVAFNACDGSSRTKNEYQVLASDGEKFVFKAIKAEEGLSVYDALVSLQEEGKLIFDGYTGDYGFTVTAVNGSQNAADWSSCWMVYTDLTEYNDITYATTEYGSFTYENKTYASASYGISGLPVVEGYTYVLHYDVFEQ